MKRINMNVFWPAINWNTFTLTKHTPNIRTFIWIWSSLYTLSLSRMQYEVMCEAHIGTTQAAHGTYTEKKKWFTQYLYYIITIWPTSFNFHGYTKYVSVSAFPPFTSTVFQYFSNGKNVLAQHFMCHYYPHTQAWIASKAIWIASIERSI